MRQLSLWLAAVPVLFPIYLLISLSLKTPNEAATSGLGPPRNPTLNNYTSALTEARAGSVTFARATFNSCAITAATVLIVIAVAAPAGYVLARRASALSRGLFALFSAGMVLPAYLSIIPLFAFMIRYNLAGTLVGIFVVYAALYAPFAIFLYAQFFRALPRDYEEAAQVDGATSLRAVVQVVLPLVRPVTGTVAVFVGVLVWKDFFYPLIFLGGSDHMTLPVAIHSLVAIEPVIQWNLIFAAIVIAMAPILAIYGVMQRYVVRGFTSAVRQ